jgi:VWFA-related protein
VQVDVIVTDKAGKPITDLRPEDFEIFENDKRQPLTNFSYIAANGTPSDAPAPNSERVNPDAKNRPPVVPARLKRESVRRTIALVADDLGLSLESFGYVRQALTKFVDEQLQPNDLVAILRTSGSVGVLQQFTSDRRELQAAVDRLRWNPYGRGGVSPVGTLNEQSIGADIRDSIQFTEEMEESRAGMYSVGTLGQVTSIIRALGDMPGRKSLVLVSEAFRLFSAQGRNTQLMQLLRSLTDEANANSVAIYTLDASGLQTYTIDASDKVAGYSYLIDPDLLASSGGLGGVGVKVNPPPRTLPRADTLSAQAERDSSAAFRRLGALSSMRENQAGESHTVLSYLAQRTGGIFLRNRNDLADGIRIIMEDQHGYYLLGYRPDESTIGVDNKRVGLRNLTVKVKRSGLNVRSRAGYIGINDEDNRVRPRTREAQLTAALISPFSSTDIRVRLTSLFGDEPDAGGTFLRSLVHVDARDLTFKPEAGGARNAELEMVAVAFSEGGQIVDQLSYPQKVQVDNEDAYKRIVREGLVYILHFPIKRGGPYQMRVAVRDASSERIGAATQFVEVPDLSKNRVALSGIVLTGITEKQPAPADGEDVQSGPAVRRLRAGMLLDYRYSVYNAQRGADNSGSAQAQMRLFREGNPVFTGKVVPLTAASDPKRIKGGGRIRIGPELSPGSYVLQVVVTDMFVPAKPRTATQWIDFEIVQ